MNGSLNHLLECQTFLRVINYILVLLIPIQKKLNLTWKLVIFIVPQLRITYILWTISNCHFCTHIRYPSNLVRVKPMRLVVHNLYACKQKPLNNYFVTSLARVLMSRDNHLHSCINTRLKPTTQAIIRCKFDYMHTSSVRFHAIYN